MSSVLFELGYRDKGESRAYLATVSTGLLKKEIVDTHNPVGLRWSFLGIHCEMYITDKTPILDPVPYWRVIFWQPLTVRRPAGWLLSVLADEQYQHGVAVLNRDEYWTTWSSHARRHRRKWLEDTEHVIEELDLETFGAAYHATKKLEWLTRTGFVRVLNYHLERHPQDVHLFGVREKQSGRVVAGLAVIDYPDIGVSLHTSAFIHPDAQRTSVGVGLIDHWFKTSRARGLQFLNFGIIWREGNPNAWKGYSQFKLQFDLQLIRYPRSFFRIVKPNSL